MVVFWHICSDCPGLKVNPLAIYIRCQKFRSHNNTGSALYRLSVDLLGYIINYCIGMITQDVGR